MRFGVLGPLAVWTDNGRLVTVPGRKVRALLADLLEREGRPASADRLIEDLWGEELPGNPAAALSAKVSQLRRVLDEAEPGARTAVTSSPAGYALLVDAQRVDAHRFRALVSQALDTDAPATRAAILSEAQALWRGPAFADLADEAFVQPAVTRLEELRITAFEDLAEARLQLGEHSAITGGLREALDAHPLRERLRSAHMRALYGAGRQHEALESYEQLRAALADELGLSPGPELAALRQAILKQDPSLGRPMRPRTNLYLPATSLVGRDDAIAGVVARLGAHRLVTLTGPGGVGKTRLAIEAAARVRDTCPDGVWLVDLAPLPQPATRETIADVMMRILDIHDPADSTAPPAPADRVADTLRGRRLLLVLDNCDHVIQPVAEVAQLLLRAAPDVRLLATSREPLSLSEEVVWSVAPLEVPDVATEHDPASLARYSAVRLLLDRTAAASRELRPTSENAPAIALLCRRLDGIPLALEMAATRVRALGVRGVAAQLDDRFRLLGRGHRDAPARHQSLMAMIDWSWDLLSDPERVVLRRLAVTAGGCSLEAAQDVGAGEDAPRDDIPDLLTRLVDRSLVVAEPSDDGPRYRLLESVAAYCAGRIDEAGERAQIRRRHQRFYSELAERAAPHLWVHDQRAWLRRLDAEAANLDAALKGLVADGQPEPALRLADALAWYWFLRGRLTHARRSLATVLALGGERSRHHARAVAWATGFAFMQGDHMGWAGRRQAVIRQFDGVDDPAGRCRALWFLAFAASEVDDVGAGLELLDQALDGFRASGDRWGQAATLVARARVAHIRGEPAIVEREVKLASRLFAEVGDRWGQLQAAQWLGGLAEMTGQYGRADGLQREALRMAEELELWPSIAELLAWRGWIAVQRGEYALARQWAEKALRLAKEQSHQNAIKLAEIALGFADRRQGRIAAAEARFSGLLEALQEEGAGSSPPYLSVILVGLGQAAEQRGDASAAVMCHRRALHLSVGRHRMTAMALEGLAGSLCVADQHAEAARFLGAAATVRGDRGLSPAPAEQGDLDRITDVVRAALPVAAYRAEFRRGARLSPADCLREADAIRLGPSYPGGSARGSRNAHPAGDP